MKLKKIFAVILAGCIGIGMLPLKASAEEEQSVGNGEFSIIVDNACSGSVEYEVTIGSEKYDIEIPAYDSYRFSGISKGTDYKVIWSEGTEPAFEYTEPENKTITGTAQESFTDEDGNMYTSDEISSSWTDSSGLQHSAESDYITESLLTFTRQSRSVGLINYYWYRCDQDGTESKQAMNAEGARTNLQNAYPDYTIQFYNENNYSAAAYSGVAEVSEIRLSFQAEAVSAQTDKGGFTVATFNVDGMPKEIKVLGIPYELNADGPGSTGSLAISKGMAERNWDLIATSENFNYMSELMSEMRGYEHTTLRDSIGTEFNLSNMKFPFDTDGLSLFYKNYLKVDNEQMVPWNTHYSPEIANIPIQNGADGMIDKGYRTYQVEFAPEIVVDVYILHMDADSDPEDIAAREEQIIQLADAIKASDNGNPIIVMGDTNCRYTRENLETLFIDSINSDGRFTVKDAWVEKVWDGVYPVHGSSDMVAIDKGGTYTYPQAEIVDKVFYINNSDSDIELTVQNYTVASDFVNDEGDALADHWPVVVDFQYEKRLEECNHNYVAIITEPTCTTPGYTTFTCSICGDTYIGNETSAKGHAFGEYQSNDTEHWRVCSGCREEERSIHIYGSDKSCTVCGYKEAQEPEESNGLLGETTLHIESGKKYVISFSGSSGEYLLTRNGKKIEAQAMDLSEGETVSPDLVWTITEAAGKFQISAEIDGQRYYIYRTNSVTSTGYKIGIRTEPFLWTLKDDLGDIRFYVKSNTGKNHYLRYYNSKLKWISSTKSAGLTIYEVK